MTSRSVSKSGEFIFPRLFLIFFLSFSLILIYSLSPGVYAGDSGLFTSASYFLGTAHPPAYPLYILLGKSSTFIPFGNIAFKVNLLSAILGALAVLLAYETALYVTKHKIISILAPLTILASPNFILESSKAEVYTLNIFLIVLLFYLGIRAVKEPDFFKKVLISSFIMGLGIGNHHSIGFMVFVIFYVIIIRRKELPFGTVALSIVLFITGFSVYFSLYLRSVANTFIGYSLVYSFEDFLKIFLRADYPGNTVIAVGGVSHYGAHWFYAIRNIGLILSKEIHPLMWFFVLAGLVSIFSDKKMFGYIAISVLTWVFLGKMVIGAKEPSYDDFVIITPYFLQLIPILGVIAAAGLYKSYEKIKVHSTLTAKTVVTGLIVFQMVYFSISIQKSSLSDYLTAYGWIKNISKVLKPKSFYLAFGDDPGFLSFYGFGVERLRDDVLCLDAATGSNNFRLTLSPQWKFDIWYPEFYQAEITSGKYFYPIAKKGKLYASMIGSIPKKIRDKFDTRWYVLVSILLSKDNDFPFRESFKDNFEKIDYLQSAAKADETDFLVTEIIKCYVLTFWEYANLFNEENTEDTDYFYRLALTLSVNNWQRFSIIKDYIKFLEEKRGAESAQKFMSMLKNAASDADIETKKEVGKIEEWYRVQNTNRK